MVLQNLPLSSTSMYFLMDWWNKWSLAFTYSVLVNKKDLGTGLPGFN